MTVQIQWMSPEFPLPDVQAMATADKRTILMKHRKKELRKLIDVYYAERGWTDKGIPKPDTLKRIGLWDFLSPEAQARITEMNG